MPARKDPTEAICKKAASFAEVDEGTSCTQASFKRGGKAFLYIGPQGGRFKAMFKLEASRAEAEKLAKKEPDRFDVGSTAWVTARFSAEKPMPKKLWEAWLKESYELSAGTKKKAAAKKKAAPRKKVATKKARRKSS